MISMQYIAVFAVLVLSAVADPDVCTCEIAGNLYTPVLDNDCRTFTQEDTSTNTVSTLSCPGDLVFDLELCICVWPEQTTCACRDDLPGPTTGAPTAPPTAAPTLPPAPTTPAGPVICEQAFNQSYNQFLNFAQTGQCAEAAQLEADIYSVCVVNDQAALAVLSWQYLAVNVGFCGTAGLSDGCHRLTECVALLSRPGYGAVDFTEQIRCEHFYAATQCLECAYNNGCPVASTYSNELTAATPKLCKNYDGC